MTRGSLTRAGPLPKADQRWRIKVLIGFGAIFVALLVEGIVLYQTTLNNRGIGNGNRVVQCATLERVAPSVHLPECAGGGR